MYTLIPLVRILEWAFDTKSLTCHFCELAQSLTLRAPHFILVKPTFLWLICIIRLVKTFSLVSNYVKYEIKAKLCPIQNLAFWPILKWKSKNSSLDQGYISLLCYYKPNQHIWKVKILKISKKSTTMFLNLLIHIFH